MNGKKKKISKKSKKNEKSKIYSNEFFTDIFYNRIIEQHLLNGSAFPVTGKLVQRGKRRKRQ